MSEPAELAAMASRLDELQAVCERVSQENAELRQQLSATIPPAPTSEGASLAAGPRPDDSGGGVGGGGGGVGSGGGGGVGSGGGGEMTRRKVLTKVLGAAAVTAVGGGILLDRAQPAAAATADNVLAGETTTAENPTTVQYDGAAGYAGVVLLGNDSYYSGNGANYPAAVGGWAGAGVSAGSGGVPNGVYGYTDNGAGNGVVGYNSNLVAGSGAGVLGLAFGATSVAVQGTNPAGTAVAASGATGVVATGSGSAATALRATAASTASAVVLTNTGTGAALQVTGRLHFSRSGHAVVPGSHSTPHSVVTVTDVPLTTTSKVLATLQTYISGVAVAAVVTDPAASSFTIHLTTVVPVMATVEWLVLD